MNLMKCEENVNDDITNEIKRKETNTECNTTGKKRWNRKCPICGNGIVYTKHHRLVFALNKNGKCKKCNQKRYNSRNVWKRPCPTCGKEKEYKQKSHWLRAIRENRKCEYCANDHSTDFLYKKKQRISRMAYLEKTYGYQPKPVFNLSACDYFDIIGCKNGWKLKHAKNGGEHYISELGYWLDAYDKKNNVVVEYDESKHYTKHGHLKQKDIDRMNEICHHLKCDFWRYNEKKGTLTKYEYTK